MVGASHGARQQSHRRVHQARMDPTGRPPLHHHQPQATRDPRPFHMPARDMPHVQLFNHVNGADPRVFRVLRIVHRAAPDRDERVIRAVVAHHGDSDDSSSSTARRPASRIRGTDHCEHSPRRHLVRTASSGSPCPGTSPTAGYVDHSVERHMAIESCRFHRLQRVHASHAEPDDVDDVASRRIGRRHRVAENSIVV